MVNDAPEVAKRAKRPRIKNNNMYTPAQEQNITVSAEFQTPKKKRKTKKRRKQNNNMYTPPFLDQRISQEISGMFKALFRSGTKGVHVVIKHY